MLLMPYDTTICKLYDEKKITNQIKRAQIDLSLPEVETPGGNRIKNLFFVTPSEEHEDVANFTQFVNLGTDQEPKLVFDGRPYMRLDRRTGTYRLTAANDFMFQCIRGALTLRIMSGDSNVLRRLGDVPAITFVRWITLALAQRYNLDLATQIRMSIVVAYYYYSLIDVELATNKEARIQMANIVARVTRADLRTVSEVSDNIEDISNIDAFTQTISNDLGSIRMGQIKFPDLFTLIAPSFVGVNYRENVGVALEHLPTFIAMVYMGLSDRSYRKTIISRRAETAGRTNELKQFSDLVYRHIAEQFV